MYGEREAEKKAHIFLISFFFEYFHITADLLHNHHNKFKNSTQQDVNDATFFRPPCQNVLIGRKALASQYSVCMK